MIRRRRPPREIAFSFDSFLDVVANVVGIILRLIIVAWVGAKAYKGPPPPPPPAVAVAEDEPVALIDPKDPLAPEVERRRRELAEAQARLLAEMKDWEGQHRQGEVVAGQLADLAARRQGLEEERAVLDKAVAGHGKDAKASALSLAEIHERTRKLAAEMEAIKKLPPARHNLRYQTPVSAPLQTEELLFECRRGRVTLVDIGALLEQVQRGLRQKSELLKRQWEVSDVTEPVGAFRLRYVVERQRGPLDAVTPGGIPDDRSSFHYGLAGWQVEPLASERGEPAEAALATGSAFRRTVDGIDPQQTAVTFWVYPDSFPLYRRLRDYLYERGIEVAGRPLPTGYPIASSRHGSVSRGQ